MLFGPDVPGLVDAWQPASWYGHEKKFENDLAKFLRSQLDGTTVRTQGRQRIDIRVGQDVGIELKRDLTPSKVDRLMGQLDKYDYPDLLVVVCGSSENAWEDLQERVRKYQDPFGSKQVMLFRKEEEDLRSQTSAEAGINQHGGGQPEGLFGF